jgi:hypothetical protein
MKRTFLAAVLILGVFSALGFAVTCPPGQYAVTFRYVPLPGEVIRSVSLRGSFNNWGEWPMEREPDGSWAITVCLEPGEYQYKFYINGQWPKDMATARGGGPVDPEAHGYVDDGFGGRNAIRRVGTSISGLWDFKIRVLPSPLVDHNNLNLTLAYGGYTLTSLSKFGWGGTFNEQGFELSGLVLGSTELKAGMYFDPQAVRYKHTFVELKPPLFGLDLTAKVEHWVEGYLPDDRCPAEVTFVFDPRGGTFLSVTVAGDFNGWNPTATPMTYDPATGLWSAKVRLDPGTVRYKYVINGTWVGNMSTDHPVGGGPVDADADGYVDDGFGGQNAVRIVRSPCKADLVAVTFRYKPRAWQSVIYEITVPGAWPAWTGYGWWDPSNAPSLSPQPDGTWAVTLMLPPGTFIEYKYWIRDDTNSWGYWVPDMSDFGGEGPADPDAYGYRWGGNAVRFVGDPMPSYMRYTLSAKFGNLEGILRFEDCCCGIMLKDLTLNATNLSLCCGITYNAELLFTKAGFQHLKLSFDNLFSPCCGISMGLDVEFGVAFKTVSPRFSWPGISGCFTVYGNTVGSGFSLQGIEIYGWKLHCDIGTCQYLEVLTALNVAKIEEIFNADIFQGDEYEMVKLGFCGAACCGDNWTLTVTAFFGPSGRIFDITRIWVDTWIPLFPNLTLVANFSNSGEGYLGFEFKF